MHSRKGFTLIEILVVVAIIAILASIVVYGVGPAQKKARDARRLSDLHGVQTLLEVYHQNAGKYPAASDWATFTTAMTTPPAGTANTKVPDDQRAPAKHYLYETDATQSDYVLGAELEGQLPSTALTTNPLTPGSGIPCGPGSGNQPVATYCVTSNQ
ncbi:MAG: type II secretion system protein [Candidatus Liptonbacteria bacterium]|nr:type II secretion system protein [Candidatus Liptonbacteria bacterium]